MKKKLVGNDLGEALLDIIRGKIKEEDIARIYATRKEIETYLVDLEELKKNDDEKSTQLAEEIEDDFENYYYRYRRYMGEYSRNNEELISSADFLKEYRKKAKEVLNRLTESGKICDLESHGLQKLPKLEMDIEYGLDYDTAEYTEYGGCEWRDGEEEFLISQLNAGADSNILKEYYPQYVEVIDEIASMIDILYEYESIYFDMGNKEMYDDKAMRIELNIAIPEEFESYEEWNEKYLEWQRRKEEILEQCTELKDIDMTYWQGGRNYIAYKIYAAKEQNRQSFDENESSKQHSANEIGESLKDVREGQTNAILLMMAQPEKSKQKSGEQK